jgi:hypothetical protein
MCLAPSRRKGSYQPTLTKESYRERWAISVSVRPWRSRKPTSKGKPRRRHTVPMINNKSIKSTVYAYPVSRNTLILIIILVIISADINRTSTSWTCQPFTFLPPSSLTSLPPLPPPLQLQPAPQPFSSIIHSTAHHVHPLQVPLQQVRPHQRGAGSLRRARSHGILPGWRPARCRRLPRRILQRPLRQSTPMQINPDRHPR